MGSIMKIAKTKTRVEVAAAVGAGYLLGRTHQLKLAVKIARAGGRSPSGPQDLLAEGAEFLASSPEITKLGDSVRDELLDTAAATVEATGGHVGSLRDRLRSRGANVVAGGGYLAAGVKRIGRRGHAHPQHTADSTVGEEPEHGKDEDEETPHHTDKSEDEKRPQPSRGRARLRRITPTRWTMRNQPPPAETTPKVVGTDGNR
ncbi:hypothetical protein G352_13145 [Rhodococcus ruber BKS 20-38]|uniref:Uncharacterized protein n=2 Tax=Rhodococcus ruber TaxID=1830 RepID=M2Z9Z2_9NOCA|nr:hypothetical protein G352_13145 [Rhodococcus ruber BKS 20-38]